MNKKTLEILEYYKIKEMLIEYAVSDIAKDKIKKLEPSIDRVQIEAWLKETTEGRAIVNRNLGVPLHSLQGMSEIIEKLKIGVVLKPEDFELFLSFIKDADKMKKFMSDKGDLAPSVSTYALSISELKDIQEEITRCILNNRVYDKASPRLSKIRKRIGIFEERVKAKLEGLLRNPKYSRYFQDNLVCIRNGKYVIPIKSEYKNSIKGCIVDSSASGSTVFIEPEEIGKAHSELNLLKIEEDKEEFKILSELTDITAGYLREININVEIMTQYDFIFAKAKLSRFMDGNTVNLNNDKYIKLINAKHPLIGKDAVALNFNIGKDYRGLIITGPNTGGKTVVLKTVGLLTLMVQSGLHIPVDDGSEISIFYDILADIGDGQSIEQSLSTFSSHIKNIISIMECANSNTLIIMDELGAGTDPAEGMGLAISILEYTYNLQATILATTHYSEIKEFAEKQEGFQNGSMEFDVESLKPLYKLRIGKAGDSNAFLIALRLGMDSRIIERAHEITYKSIKKYENYCDENQKIKEEAVSHKEQQQEKIKELEDKEKVREKIKNQNKPSKFNIGDCVYINSMNKTGIVYELENTKGEIGVMVMKKKLKINKKRLKLYIKSEELYPEDYDFDIVFETVENRKKDHMMSKRHVEGMFIERE